MFEIGPQMGDTARAVTRAAEKDDEQAKLVRQADSTAAVFAAADCMRDQADDTVAAFAADDTERDQTDRTAAAFAASDSEGGQTLSAVDTARDHVASVAGSGRAGNAGTAVVAGTPAASGNLVAGIVVVETVVVGAVVVGAD